MTMYIWIQKSIFFINNMSHEAHQEQKLEQGIIWMLKILLFLNINIKLEMCNVSIDSNVQKQNMEK